jgi:hypothetical protein
MSKWKENGRKPIEDEKKCGQILDMICIIGAEKEGEQNWLRNAQIEGKTNVEGQQNWEANAPI